jgi:putative ABC transport system substrate-binding protein
MLAGSAQLVVQAAAESRLPVMYPGRIPIAMGGLLAYGASVDAVWRRTAYYIDRVLKGAKPADLPVEQPMTFDLVVNLKTA